MDELMVELLKEEYSLINFIVFKSPNRAGAIRQINKQISEQINKQIGLTEKELNEIFEPATNAVKYCTVELIKKMEEKKNDNRSNNVTN